ncbi:MAG: hypothetical protein Kow0089_20910 [Desulfobulbaceae bacterium]
MKHYDVFNGDADGICALHQLRLSDPRPAAELITGVKRDISLLSRLDEVHDASITVLDISLDRNRESLMRLLELRNEIFYVDHHFSGPIPAAANLTAHIDPDPLTCTSIIVDRLLEGKYRSWAVVGAFGDNLDESARRLAAGLGLDEEQTGILRETGILLNYNGYGATLDDLYFAPEDLFRRLHAYVDPFVFSRECPALTTLRHGFRDDMARARSAAPLLEDDAGRVFQLEGKPWARRVAGVFSNELARERPDLAHALIIPNSDSTLRISVRSPLVNRTGADVLCRRFPTGGGRAAAAGINNLPPEMKESFLSAFSDHFRETIVS